jgi:RNA polymerase sigma-70 factor, ECF subfamily
MATDSLIVRRAIEGDERALRVLWTEHAPHVDAVVRRLCSDPELAADIAQEVWMQIFRALPSYRGDAQFGTWAHRIAVNQTLNVLRKVKRVTGNEMEMEDDVADSLASADNAVERGFLADSIEQAMKQLPEGARTVFVLFDIEGYSHEEIAQKLGITEGGSKSQLSKARAKLRRLLAHLVDVPTVGERHAAII